MKLSWKDAMTTLLAIAGGAVVYAKIYDYSWALIGSWRGAVAVMAVIGLLLFAFSSFNFANRSILNVTEMVLGVVAIGLAVTGLIMTSEFVFYALALTLGAFWLIDTARHVRHSFVDEGHLTFHHHAPVH